MEERGYIPARDGVCATGNLGGKSVFGKLETGYVDKDLVIAGLVESNDILQEEVSRLRTSNRILRTVFRQLRACNESLHRQVETAQFNDETFKSFCNGEFDAPVSKEVTSGLLGASYEVEPLDA